MSYFYHSRNYLRCGRTPHSGSFRNPAINDALKSITVENSGEEKAEADYDASRKTMECQIS
jgi:hypothetical protein